MSDEQFIDLVKRYPILYNASLPQYRDQHMRISVWEEIAHQLNDDAEECKARWGKLRNCFTNALKRRRKKKSGQASTITIPWKYENQMKFLLIYLGGKCTETNILESANEDVNNDINEDIKNDIDDDINNDSTLEDDSAESIASSTPTDSKTRVNGNKRHSDNSVYLDGMVKVMKASNELREKKIITETDESDHFFLSMSKQLKQLPIIEQSRIKFKIHKLIHEAQMSFLEKK